MGLRVKRGRGGATEGPGGGARQVDGRSTAQHATSKRYKSQPRAPPHPARTHTRVHARINTRAARQRISPAGAGPPPRPRNIRQETGRGKNGRRRHGRPHRGTGAGAQISRKPDHVDAARAAARVYFVVLAAWVGQRAEAALRALFLPSRGDTKQAAGTRSLCVCRSALFQF